MGRKKKDSEIKEQPLFNGEQNSTGANSDEKELGLIEQTAKNWPNLIKELGGMEIVRQRLALSKVVFGVYKERGKNLQEIINSVLDEFRDRVSKGGYKGIDPEMIPIVRFYGSIKDKAALILSAYFEMSKVGKKPLMSFKEVEAIKDEIQQQGREYMIEYMNYLSLRDSMNNQKNLFYRAKYAYLATASQMAEYIHLYEWLGKAEQLFNAFAPLVADDKEEEFKALAKEYNDYLNNFQAYGGLEEETGEGWVDRQRKNSLEYAKSMYNVVVRNRLSEFKGIIKGFEKWVKDNSAEMFVTYEMKMQRLDAPLYCTQNLQNKYFLSCIQEEESRGVVPTEELREIAFIEDYEQVEPNEDAAKYIYKRLNEKEVFK